MSELEQKILSQINKFRKDSKAFLDKSDKISQKNLNDYKTFLISLNKIPELNLNQDLSNIAKEEAKKFFEDPGYNRYQIGEEFQPKLSEIFSKKESALIALDELNDIEDLIPKIILNSIDKEKKGRKILSNSEYTCLGIGCFIFEESEETEETSYVLIFSKEQIKEDKINEESINLLSKEENVIYEQIKKFRENPMKFNLKKYQKMIKKKYRQEYESFILKLQKMPELILDKELNKIAKEEVKKLSEEEEYNKIGIGEELNIKFNGNFKLKDSALIALENINKYEELIPNIIINESDINKKGRIILTKKEFTHIGISQLIIANIIYIVIIFSKIPEKDDKRNGTSNSEIIINGANKIKAKKIIKEESKNSSDNKKKAKIESIKNDDNSFVRNKEINNIIEVYFFTSIQYDYRYGNISVQINKIEQNNHKIFDNFEYKQEYDNTQHFDNFFIYYFKLIIPKKSKFQLFLYYDNDYYYFSEIIEVNNNNNLLGYIKLNSNKFYVNQIIYKDISLLYQYQKLLNMFTANKAFLIPFLEKYKLSKNSIKLEELLNTLNIFSEYNCKPIFLKALKWEDIELNNRRVDNISLSDNLKKIISSLNSNVIQEEKDNEKIRDIILKVYGYVYYKYFRNQFKILMNNNDKLFIESIKRLIKANIIKMNELIKKDLIDKNKIIEFFSFVIENENSDNGLKILFGELNLNESLKIIVRHYELLKDKIIKINSEKYFFQKYFELDLNASEKDDIEEIFILLKQYLEKAKKYETKIINLDNLIIKLNEVNEKNKNLDNLIKLKEEAKYLQGNNEIKFDTLFKLYESIHDIGISFCIKKKFSNNEIIQFIQNDIFYISDEYIEHSKRDPKIFKNFDIYDFNKSGFIDFIQLKLYSKFEKKLKTFYEIFIDKIRTLDDLNILFELFPEEQLDSVFIELLLKKIEKIADRTYYYINNGEQLLENMYIIVRNIVKNKSNINKFTNIIENSYYFKYDNMIKKIYIYILSKNNEEINNNKNVIDEFAKYFINIINEIDAKEIYKIIKTCISNKKFLIKIFNNKEITDSFIYDENDIYSSEISPKLDLYKLFIEKKFVNDINFLNTIYFENISRLNNKIFLNMRDLNIKFLKISNLIDKHEKDFLAKLKLFFINEENNIDEIFKKICDNIKKCKNKLSELERIKNYLINFEPNKGSKIIIDIKKIINFLRSRKIKEILEEKETEKINDINILIEKSKNIRFKDSIIFMLIYDELKQEKINYDEIELFNEALEKYKLILKKIINYKNEIFLKIEKINSILNLLKTKEDEIEQEMKFISEEFKNDLIEKNISINDIKQNLINFSNLKEIREYINGIHWLLKIFKTLNKNSNIEETQYTSNLSKIKETLSSDNSDNIKGGDVENGFKILLDYEINIKDICDFNIFIFKVYGKEDEIKFCIGKKDEDIKNLNEYLIDRQSESGNLQPEDFDDFIGSKKYINEIIEANISNDKELFNLLKNKFNAKIILYLNLIIILKNMEKLKNFMTFPFLINLK